MGNQDLASGALASLVNDGAQQRSDRLATLHDGYAR